MTEILTQIVLFLHFLGLASLLGGTLTQVSSANRSVNGAMLHGAFTQLATGLGLLALTLADANHIKVTVKLAVLVVILVILLLKRKAELATAPFFAVLALTVANVGIAVFW